MQDVSVSITKDFGTINANTISDFTNSPKAIADMADQYGMVIIGWPTGGLPQGITLPTQPWISAPGEITIRMENTTGSNITVGSITFTAMIMMAEIEL